MHFILCANQIKNEPKVLLTLEKNHWEPPRAHASVLVAAKMLYYTLENIPSLGGYCFINCIANKIFSRMLSGIIIFHMFTTSALQFLSSHGLNDRY